MSKVKRSVRKNAIYTAIVSCRRYRKVNLYGESNISTTAQPDVVTFTTDFGVEFGHFICFDLLFETPANVLVRRGVQNFAFPTMWFAELPFLSGELFMVFGHFFAVIRLGIVGDFLEANRMLVIFP